VRFSEESEANGCGWKNNSNQYRVYDGDAKIVRPSPCAPNRLFAQWQGEFQHCESGKHSAERDQTDNRFISKQKFTHTAPVQQLPPNR
jgi:hypothetical protein